MAKDMNELNTRVPHVSSRSEQYLNYLVGRATTLDTLPAKPGSRVEEYLELLCYLGWQGGGGGGQPFVGLTNATLNGDTITFNKSDGTTLNVSLTDFIRGELTKVGGQANANKIPQLNADGKVDISMIPDLSINKIHSANNEIEANELINNGTAQIGDTIIVKDTGSVYLYVNDQAVDFGNRTIEIAFANGAVKMVNGEIPNPQGNVTVKAEHIEYVDTQIGLGGTTVQEAIQKINEKFVSNIEFEDTTRTLKKTISGQEEDVVSGLVTQWGDLEYIIEHKIANIFNEGAIIDSQHHHANGVITNEPEWCRYEIPCKPNEVISIAKKKHDSQVITFLNSSGNRVMSDSSTSKSVNGWQHYIITVPSNNDIEKVSINIYKPHNPLGGNNVMIYKGDKEPTTEYYPFANGYNVIVDGSKVSLTFDPTDSSLKSLTTHDAIIELDKKIVNARTVKSVNGIQPQADGNVVIDAEHINYNDAAIGLGGTSVQDAIRLLNDKIGASTAGVSDVTYDNNKTLTITKNGQQNQIDLTPLVGIKTINTQAGTDGAINLSISNVADSVEFKVENHTYATLNYMTDQEADDIIDSFNF